MPARSRNGAAAARQRRRMELRGRVQGVGMRPYLSRLAAELGLAGWVGNVPDGVVVEIEGTTFALARFDRRLREGLPARAHIEDIQSTMLVPLGATDGFHIIDSLLQGRPSPCIPPDLATCPACVSELFDPGNRRYRHPFISCCDCGPRYSILRALPFDRSRTVMAGFEPCPRCMAEYADRDDRRYHAQTLCCHDCGPRLEWLNARGERDGSGGEALAGALDVLRGGGIVALRGVGGFQLLVDAGREAAVAGLRARKQRPAKPFALLMDATMATALAEPSAEEMDWLQSAAAPIVLLRRRAVGRMPTVAPAVTPGLSRLGVMLPASPLHHLIVADFGAPLVATSGNRGGEPLCLSTAEALDRLAGIADGFLVHDRDILRPLDDSVLRLAAGRPLTLRRARGYVPELIDLAAPIPALVAAGGQQKCVAAAGTGTLALVGPHLGDLDDALTRDLHRQALDELPAWLGIDPVACAGDRHPDYGAVPAGDDELPVVPVGHHYAHALACMAEHAIEPPFLAIAWDGLGLGEDGSLWGGEFLRVDDRGCRRLASLLPLPLPGGEAAIREPRRMALAALHTLYGADCLARMPPPLRARFASGEAEALLRLLGRPRLNPSCSSVGRLFDAVAALLDLCAINRHEGEAAMLLEACAETADIAVARPYSFALLDGEPLRIDWRPLLAELVADFEGGADHAVIAARFHVTLAEAALRIAAMAIPIPIALCGGCFQNRLLLEACVDRLRRAGHAVYWPQRVPPNDGGLALGQLLGAARRLQQA